MMPALHTSPALFRLRTGSLAALILCLACGSASAALVQVTITGTFNGTDHYSNTWPNILTTQSVTASAITNQAYTARFVYETGILTPERDAWPQSNFGSWDNITNFGNSQVYESAVVSSDLTIYGQTIAMDTNFGSQIQSFDYLSGADTFGITGSDIHGPGDTVDNEHISLYINKADLFPVPFIASEAPAGPVSLYLGATGAAYLDVKLFDYLGCKTLSTTYSLPAVRNCPADRFSGSATHWVDGSGTVTSVTIAQVVPLPAGGLLLGTALVGAMGWMRRKTVSR